jgi:hypothetical protein
MLEKSAQINEQASNGSAAPRRLGVGVDLPARALT